MCFSLPAKVTKVIDKKTAEIIQHNQKRQIKTELLKDININDWILTNADMAVSKITEDEAKTINNYFKEKC
jgi:hydrogenase assembly chaperone HypC/HupF